MILGANLNHIRDLAPLAGLTELSSLALVGNEVVDVTPLADNPGLGAGDFVYLDQNQLACDSQQSRIEALRARGATVTTDCP